MTQLGYEQSKLNPTNALFDCSTAYALAVSLVRNCGKIAAQSGRDGLGMLTRIARIAPFDFPKSNAYVLCLHSGNYSAIWMPISGASEYEIGSVKP